MSIVSYFSPLIAQYGLVAIFTTVGLESLGLPLPGETVIILGAGLAGAGQLNIYAVALTAFLAAVIGDNIGYLVGRKFGRPVIAKYGKRVWITEGKLHHAEHTIQTRGPVIVVIARFIVILRQLNGLAAGTVGMHWLTFLIANAIGAALWVGLWTTIAYQFGHSVSVLPFVWNHLGLVAGIAIPLLIAVTIYIYFRHIRPPSR